MIWRYAGLGMEIVAGVAGFVILGWWLDRRFETGRTWLIVGSILGSVGAFYHLIRQAVRMQRETEAAARRRRSMRNDEHD